MGNQVANGVMHPERKHIKYNGDLLLYKRVTECHINEGEKKEHLQGCANMGPIRSGKKEHNFYPKCYNSTYIKEVDSFVANNAAGNIREYASVGIKHMTSP